MPTRTEAKKHTHKKKKPKFNDFGCVNAGNFCQNSGQCCSGICQGRKGKKKCQAHDASSCQAGQNSQTCGGSASVACTTSNGGDGECFTTTGNGEFCASTGACFACTKDADCQAVCGPLAACAPCTRCPEPGTISLGAGLVSCST